MLKSPHKLSSGREGLYRQDETNIGATGLGLTGQDASIYALREKRKERLMLWDQHEEQQRQQQVPLSPRQPEQESGKDGAIRAPPRRPVPVGAFAVQRSDSDSNEYSVQDRPKGSSIRREIQKDESVQKDRPKELIMLPGAYEISNDALHPSPIAAKKSRLQVLMVLDEQGQGGQLRSNLDSHQRSAFDKVRPTSVPAQRGSKTDVSLMKDNSRFISIARASKRSTENQTSPQGEQDDDTSVPGPTVLRRDPNSNVGASMSVSSFDPANQKHLVGAVRQPGINSRRDGSSSSLLPEEEEEMDAYTRFAHTPRIDSIGGLASEEIQQQQQQQQQQHSGRQENDGEEQQQQENEPHVLNAAVQHAPPAETLSEHDARSNKRRCVVWKWVVLFCLVLLVPISVVVGIALAQNNRTVIPESGGTETSPIPSLAPSNAPTVSIQDSNCAQVGTSEIHSFSDRFVDLEQVLPIAVNETAPGSPARLAYCWLALVDEASADGRATRQRFVLATIAYSFKASSSSSSSASGVPSFVLSWPENESECIWDGIECNSGLEVTTIKLRGMGLTGPIPTEIAFLSTLCK